MRVDGGELGEVVLRAVDEARDAGEVGDGEGFEGRGEVAGWGDGRAVGEEAIDYEGVELDAGVEDAVDELGGVSTWVDGEGWGWGRTTAMQRVRRSWDWNASRSVRRARVLRIKAMMCVCMRWPSELPVIQSWGHELLIGDGGEGGGTSDIHNR